MNNLLELISDPGYKVWIESKEPPRGFYEELQRMVAFCKAHNLHTSKMFHDLVGMVVVEERNRATLQEFVAANWKYILAMPIGFSDSCIELAKEIKEKEKKMQQQELPLT